MATDRVEVEYHLEGADGSRLPEMLAVVSSPESRVPLGLNRLTHLDEDGRFTIRFQFSGQSPPHIFVEARLMYSGSVSQTVRHPVAR